MEQEWNKNAETNFHTDEKSLLEEMKLIITDFFVCDFIEEENALIMRLANGQKFKFTLKEVK